MNRAVVLDRDGVLNHAILRDGQPYPPRDADELRIVEEAAPALLRLREAGFPHAELNLGGLHQVAGREAVLPYLFLDDADRARLRLLRALGVRVAARDLPGYPEHPLHEWLEESAP